MLLMPLYDKIVVKMENKQEVKSGKLTYVKNLSTSANSTIMGKVVAVGEGRTLNNGTVLPLSIKAGQQVMYNKYAGTQVMSGQDKYLILKETDILAIVKEK